MMSHYKMIAAGNIIQFRKTGLPFYYGFEEHKRKHHNPCVDPERIKENRGRSLFRALDSIGWTLQANHGTWKKPDGSFYPVHMMTNTFQENIQDIKQANKKYTDFLKSFNYLVYGKKCSELKYLKVMEFQGRGAIHFHNILFNLPFVKKLYDRALSVWPYGTVNFVPKPSIDEVRSYVTKYLTKDLHDERLRGEKSYSVSRGLKKPITRNDERIIIPILESLPLEFKVVDEIHKSEYYGTTQIISYVLPHEHPLLPKING